MPSPFTAGVVNLPDPEPSRCFSIKLNARFTPTLYGDGATNYRCALVFPGNLARVPALLVTANGAGVVTITAHPTGSPAGFKRWPYSGTTSVNTRSDALARCRCVARGVRLTCNQPALTTQGTVTFAMTDSEVLTTTYWGNGSGNRVIFDGIFESMKNATGSWAVSMASLIQPHQLRVPAQDTVLQRVWGVPNISAEGYVDATYDGGTTTGAGALENHPFRSLVMLFDSWTTGVASVIAPIDIELDYVYEFKFGAGSTYESFESIPPAVTGPALRAAHNYLTTNAVETWSPLRTVGMSLVGGGVGMVAAARRARGL